MNRSNLSVGMPCALLLALGAFGNSATAHPITIDATPLSAQSVYLVPENVLPDILLSESSSQEVELSVGEHHIFYASGGPSPTVYFMVTGDGKVSYAPALEAFLDGAGTSSLLIHGSLIDVDPTPLSTDHGNFLGMPLTGTEWLVPNTLCLLPGGHHFLYGSGGPSPGVSFAVEVDGTVSYDPALEIFMDGAGTSSLLIHGSLIDVDPTPLSTDHGNFLGMPLTGTEWLVPHTLRVLPGGHQFIYGSGGPSPNINFAVEVDGTVSYDPALEIFMDGVGTTSVLIHGSLIDVDATPLSTMNVIHLAGIAVASADWELMPQTLRVLPGGHLFFYGSGGPTPSVHFVVEVDGTVSYAPALEGILLGSDTTSLTLAGAAIRIAFGPSDSVSVVGIQPFSSCDPLALLPGGHELSRPSGSVNFIVQENGTVDFETALDSQLSGRGTSTLSLRDTAGDPFACNVDPVAVCALTEVMAECTSAAGAAIALDGSASFDPDGDTLLFHWDVSDLSVALDDPESDTPSGTFPVGVTMATLTVSDGQGGVDTCDVVVTVQDTVPPEVMCTTNVAALWPPNHTMRNVQIKVVATDVCQEPGEILPLVVQVRSDEPDNANGNGDGNTTGDVNMHDGYAAPVIVTGVLTYNAAQGAWIGTIKLRAERAGSGDGRAYTIDAMAIDSHNNVAMSSCVVVVPHDQSG